MALTLWSTTGGTSGVRFMPCATLTRWSTTASHVLWKWRRTPTKFSRASKPWSWSYILYWTCLISFQGAPWAQSIWITLRNDSWSTEPPSRLWIRQQYPTYCRPCTCYFFSSPTWLPRSLSHLSQIQKGASSARADDTKSLKSAILDWITPRGQTLNPPLARNVKTDRGFHHERTGALLCPAELDWSSSEWVDQTSKPLHLSC